MKKIKLLLIITIACLFTINCFSQTPELWGMTSDGGYYPGNIFNITGDSTGFSTAYFFDSSGGVNPIGNLIQASNGLLYGVAQNGGSLQKGTIYTMDPATNTYSNVGNFDGVNGQYPSTSLVQASNGLLYGKCQVPGNYNIGYAWGKIFSFNPVTHKITYLSSFEGINSTYPGGSLFQASDGMLYGMSVFKGIWDYGTLFRYDIALDTLIILENFDSLTIGANPWGTLMQASNGLLYGMTKNGGAHNWGNIFSFDLSYDSLAVLYEFTGLHGLNPDGTLIEVSNGLLYGVLQGSVDTDTSGNIFSFDPITNFYKPLYAFHFSQCGHPWGSLIQSSNGWLYGMTYYGGADTSGVIFKYNPADSAYQNIYEFDTLHGEHPRGDLVQASNGKLYGITSYGGSANNGVVFNLDTATNTYADIYDFHPVIDGRNPNGDLFLASNGLMYGMTYNGGLYNLGTLFSIDPQNNSYTSLFNFDGINGKYPSGNLVQADNGLLYGMTSNGGANDTLNYNNGDGIIFSYNISTNTFLKVYDFNTSFGYHPPGSLIKAMDGKLYGLASYGGINNSAGVLFSFNSSDNSYSDLYNFHWNGYHPTGSLVQANDGKLYGTASGGGTNNNGVVFSYNTYNNNYSVIYNFNSTNWYCNTATFIQANDGKLYGTDDNGGYYGHLFTIDLSNNSFNYVYTCTYQNQSSGYNPGNILLQGSDGEIYGMMRSAGAYNYGTVFRFDIPTDSLIKIKDFNGFDGYVTCPGLIEFNRCILTTLSASSNDTICPGDSVTLTASGATSYNWLPGNLSGNSITVSPSSTTIYTVEGITDSCRNGKNIMLTVNAIPYIYTSGDTTICEGDTLVLISSSGSSYLWNTGETTQSINVTTAGNFDVTVTNNNATTCIFVSNSVTVTVNPTPAVPVISLSGDTLISSSPYLNQWYRNGILIPGAGYPIFFPNQDGIYTVVVTNSYGCTAISTSFNLDDLGINTVYVNHSIFVYPNPFNEQTIFYNNSYSTSQKEELLIYDLMGRELKRIAVNQDKTIIYKDDIISGMYFYKLVTSTNQPSSAIQASGYEIIASGKLIIQ